MFSSSEGHCFCDTFGAEGFCLGYEVDCTRELSKWMLRPLAYPLRGPILDLAFL